MKTRKSNKKGTTGIRPNGLSYLLFIGLLLVALVALASNHYTIFSGRAGFQQPVTAQSSNDLKQLDQNAAAQIAALIREKESRTPAQRKIDSRLLYQYRMSRGLAIAEGVPTQETGLTVAPDGSIDVEISANVTKRFLSHLESIKSTIIASSAEFRSVTATIPLAEVENIAARTDVFFIQPRLEAMVNSLPAPQPGGSAQFAPANPKGNDFAARSSRVRSFITSQLGETELAGSVNSQADTTHRAAIARSIASVNGTGLKIGVLSDGVNTLAARQATGDLPATVTVLPGQAGTGDEGTAMLELVHDLAPGAQLYFATAFGSPTIFAQNIRDLRTAGCDIIVDDVTYFVETPFQDGQASGVISPGNAGVVIQAVNDVTVGSQAGAIYFSSAGNSGNKTDGTSGVWEGDFVNGGGTAAPIPAGNDLHNFGGGVTQNPLTVGGRPILKWADPLGGSTNDYDLYVLNSGGTIVVGSSTNVQSGTQDPIEDVGNWAAGFRLVIVKKTAAAGVFLHLNTNRGALSSSTTGTVYGHNGSRNSISVGATPAGPAIFNTAVGPFPNAHSATNLSEVFTSDGPRRIFFNADGTPITPGNVSSTGGTLLQKPDITAADGVSTTTPGFIPFFGTSAAAPHAAALMALVKQASPASSRTDLINAMKNSAIDIEAAGVDRDTGFGIFMPLRAMAALGVSAPAQLEIGTVTTSELLGNGNGRLEPGETVSMNVSLENLGLTTATAVSATLSTTTPGVLVTNTLVPGALNYPDLAAATGVGVNSVPFTFRLSGSAFPCGAPIQFTMTVNYAGGAAPSQTLNFTVQTAAQFSVTSTLDATAPAGGPAYTATTGTQTGRLNRNGLISSCASPKATPALQDSVAGRRYDAYTFTASASGCVNVTLTSTLNNSANNVYLAVYGNGGYSPTSILANYVADWGVTTAGTVTVGFNAVGGQQYTVVVHEIGVGAGGSAPYTLTVTGGIVGACSFVPTAAAVSIGGRVHTAAGRGIANALVRLSSENGAIYSARTNSFGVYEVNGIPSGEFYTATVSAKGHAFEPRIVNLNDNVADLDFSPTP